MNENLKNDVKDLLNQLAIKLQDVKLPEVEEYDWDSSGQGPDLASIKNYYEDPEMQIKCVKQVVVVLLDAIENNKPYPRNAEKMARAYYTSFCNGLI